MARFVRPVLVLVLCAVAFTALAAQQPKETEKPKAELFFIVQEVVKPNMIKEYEAASKQMISEFQQYKIDPAKVSWWSVSGAEFGYIYVMPIADFAAMETLHKDFGAAIETIGMERWDDIDARINRTLDRRAVFHVVRKNDLCYEPETPTVTKAEIGFLQYEFFYVIPGKEQQFEALAGKFRDLYTKHKIKQSWSFFKQVTGDDLPLYVVVEPARNESEYHEQASKTMAALGDEGESLFDEAMSCIRRMEKKNGTPRPDLSFPGENLMRDR